MSTHKEKRRKIRQSSTLEGILIEFFQHLSFGLKKLSQDTITQLQDNTTWMKENLQMTKHLDLLNKNQFISWSSVF